MLSRLLELTVYVMPIIIGLLPWFLPTESVTLRHRIVLSLLCAILIGVTYWQQSIARSERSEEFAKLPGKIANEVVKILPPGQNATQSTWGLTNEQLALLSRRMKPYAPLIDRGDLITAWASDPNSIKFAAGLVAAFRTAGWRLPGGGFNQAWFTGVPQGVIVKLHSKDDTVAALPEFVQTLREAGIEPTGEIDENVPAGDFRIIVGSKAER